MGREIATSTGLRCSALEAIADRLSASPELYLPHSSFAGRTQVSTQEKKDHLVALLHRDAAIFLERYGSKLLLSELAEFDALQGDYEVNWHLKKLKAAVDPSPGQQKSRATAVKNRRLAFLEKLVEDGHYFSEEEMRMRRPLLHHEYVGQFQDPSTWSFTRRGDKMADILIRQSEEAFIQRKLEEERKKVSEVEEEEEDEEEEEEEEEHREEEASGHKEETEQARTNDEQESYTSEVNALCCLQLSDGAESVQCQEQPRPRPQQPYLFSRWNARGDPRLEVFTNEMMAKFMAEDNDNDKKLSPEELQGKLEDFTRVMQEKFLSGEDSEHVDYAAIDGNSVLDDYWLREVSDDAEEKYFEEED